MSDRIIRKPLPCYLEGHSTREIWVEGAMVLLAQAHKENGEPVPTVKELRAEALELSTQFFPE